MNARIHSLVVGMCITMLAMAQKPAGSGADFVPTRDERSGRWGVADMNGKVLVAAEYDRIVPVGENTAVGFKGTDGAAYILGTQGRVKRIEHDAYYRAWRTALKDVELKDKALIERVLEMVPEPNKRLDEMANMEATYNALVEVRTRAVQALLRSNE